MRLFHTADLHLRESGEVSLDEQVKVLKQIDPKGGMLVVAGDIFDGASSPAERNAAIEIFTTWADAAPVVAVRGNHDRPGDVAFLSKLRAKNRIHVTEGFEFLDTPECLFVLMGWPSRGRVAAWLPEADRISVDAAATGAVRMLFAGAKVRAQSAGKPVVFVGHVELGSATMDSGQPIAGHADIAIGEDDLLEMGADVYLLGHIHKRQILRDKLVYPGSPRQMSFGEGTGHGYVTWEPGGAPQFVDIDSPQFVTVNAEWRDGSLVVTSKEFPHAGMNEHYRIVYSVPESDRSQAFESAQAMVAGVEHCKIDPTVITVDRARHTEITTARTPVEKLREYWAAKSTPERSVQILAKLSEVMS